MRKILALATLCLSMCIATAQGSKKAADIMARAEQSLYKAPCSQITFSSAYHNKRGGIEQQQTGTLLVQGELFRLEYAELLAVYDGKYLRHYDKGEDTFTISEPTKEELLQINPLYFLRARAKGFDVQEGKSKAGKQTLIYRPQGKSNIQQVSIDYRMSDALPTLVSLMGKEGGTIQFKLTKYQALTNPKPKTHFVLQQSDYPDSEFIDLR